MIHSSSNSSVTSSRLLAIGLACFGLLGGAGSIVAAPVEYSFDDAGAGGRAGSGVFTLDLGPLLMDYEATGVTGRGTTFGSWDAVEFGSTAGSFPSLVISNLIGAQVTYSFPAIGGGSIQPGSQADLEWANFLAAGAAAGLRIAPLVAEVPESSTWVSMVLLGLGIAGARFGRRD